MFGNKGWWISFQLGLSALTLYHLTKDRAFLTPRQLRNELPVRSNDDTITRQPLIASGERTTLVGNSTSSAANTLVNFTLLSDSTSTSLSPLPFPRWSGGIAVEPLAQAVHLALGGALRRGRAHRVYLIDGERAHRLARATVPNSPGRDRMPLRRGDRMEGLAVRTLRKLSADPKASERHFPNLMAAIRQGGFAYISNFADSKFCCDSSPYVNEVGAYEVRAHANLSVPIFTLSAPVRCSHAFPVPTYETVKQAAKPWQALIEEYRRRYPWERKQRRAVWRGAPTGAHAADRNSRIRLCDRAERRPDLLDAKLSSTLRSGFKDVDDTRYLGDRIHMPDFQKYRAIIDVDGHSWSSRFGELLCYSSVVLKVEPANVDYFHPELRPFVHYLPVSADLGDLYEMAEYAVSDEREGEVRRIIANANAWCLRRLDTESLMRDQAAIWDRYAGHLLEADPSYGEIWKKAKQRLLEEYEFVSLAAL